MKNTSRDTAPHAGFKPLIRAGLFLGIGMGGFFDGILFHQLLQTHNLLTGTLPKSSIRNIEINMFWDGIFHTLTWTMTLIGLILLWRAIIKHRVLLSTKCYAGSMLFGWGLFNLLEGLIDHHLLHLHHVVERLGVSMYDYAFLASGILLMLIGRAMITASRKDVHLLHAAEAQPIQA